MSVTFDALHSTLMQLSSPHLFWLFDAHFIFENLCMWDMGVLNLCIHFAELVYEKARHVEEGLKGYGGGREMGFILL